MSFLYSLPTTASVRLTELVSDPTGAHTSDLARVSAARGRVRAVLKEARRAQAGNKDWQGCAIALQEYIPHLLALMRCTETDSLLLRGVPVFAWRSTLSASSGSRKATRSSLPSFHYELVFCLLTYALALSNQATTLVLALGQYERDPGTAESDRKRGDEQINAAAETLCRAAGVLKFLAESAIPEWEACGAELRNRPPETTREVASALSKLCLADAEKLAIRRLLSKSVAVAEAVIRPGPPLPRGHPSPSLLSKLYLNVYTLYDSARSSAKSVGQSSGPKVNLMSALKRDKGQSSSTDDASDGISQDLRTYLSDGRAFSSALAYKWLGVDAGENANKIGDALAWLGLAKQNVLQLQGQGKISFSARKGKVERAKRKDRLVEELEDIEAYIKGYKHTNDTVLFQPVPSEATLLSQIPAGRSVLALKPYSLPQPAFSSRRQMDVDPAEAALAAQAAKLSLRQDPAAAVDSDSDSSEIDQPFQQSNYF